MRKWAWLVGVLATGCGDVPSAPSTSQPVQAAGLWRGDLRVTGRIGEPCVGAAFQSAAGVSFALMRKVYDQL
jgi:hypothetical protein